MKRGKSEGAIDGAIQLLRIGVDVTDHEFFVIIGNLCPLFTEMALKVSPFSAKCTVMMEHLNSNRHNRRKYDEVTQSILIDSFTSLLHSAPSPPLSLSFSPNLPLSPSPLPISSFSGSDHLVSGVIVYLCCGSEEEVDELVQSVTLLDKFFLGRFPYDVIIFHEGFGKKQIELLQVYFCPLILFSLILFSLFLISPALLLPSPDFSFFCVKESRHECADSV